jgi:hypothetical protein
MAVRGNGWFGWHLTGHGQDCPVEGPTGLRCTHPDHEREEETKDEEGA